MPSPICDLAGSGVGGSIGSSCCSTVASEGAVCGPAGSSCGGISQTSKGLEPASSASCQEVSMRPQDPPTSRVELIQHIIRKAGFLLRVVRVAAADLKHSTAALYQSKWTRFLGWCDRRGVDPCKATIPEIAEFFLFLRQKLELSVPVVKRYKAALNHVFSLIRLDLAASSVVSRMFRHFERSCSPQEIRPLDWNLSLILRCLSRPPFEPLMLASDKHLTWKTSFLLALASDKRVSELHCLSFRVCHLRGWKSCTFLFLHDYVAKTQNPSIPDSCFEEFLVPSLDYFVGDDKAELLMCPIRALRRYLSRKEQYRPGIEGLFISTRRRKKRVPHNTISFWLCSVISMAHASASEEDCCSLRVRVHEVRKVATSLLFKRRGIVRSIRCWRQECGPLSWPSWPSTWGMSPTGTWTPSPLVLWWRLSRSCNPLTLLPPV